jgi:VWFA-related protein
MKLGSAHRCLTRVWSALLYIAMLPGQPAPPVYRTTVPEVIVDAQVRDGTASVGGLQKEDFVIVEDGRPQASTYFRYGSKPVDLLVLLDRNCRLAGPRTSAALQSGVPAVARLLHPGDRMGVMAFDNEARIVEDLSPDSHRVGTALRSLTDPRFLSGGGFTNVNGAVLAAARYLRFHGRRDARRAILMITFNRGVRHARNRTVLRELWEADAVLDAVIMAPRKHDQLFALPFEADVRELVSQTGGEFIKRRLDPDSLRGMLDRLRNCYTLHYRPSPGLAGTRRSIQVKLSAPGRKKYPHAIVLARRGYVLTAPL